MLRLFDEHSSPELQTRMCACSLLFFVADRPGTVEFRGVGMIEAVELVSQVEPSTGHSFSNYAYDCALISLANEGERLD